MRAIGQMAPEKTFDNRFYLYFTITYVNLFKLNEKERMHVRTNSFLAYACE